MRAYLLAGLSRAVSSEGSAVGITGDSHRWRQWCRVRRYLLLYCLRLTSTITTDRRLRSNDAVCPLWALKSCMLHVSQREWEWETSVTLLLEIAISSSNNSPPSISSHWTEVIIRLLRNSGQLTHPADLTMKEVGRNCFPALDASQANPECPRRGRIWRIYVVWSQCLSDSDIA